MCGVQLKDKQGAKDLMLVDQVSMANSVRWTGHVLTREEGHELRRALAFDVEDQWKKGRLRKDMEGGG